MKLPAESQTLKGLRLEVKDVEAARGRSRVIKGMLEDSTARVPTGC